MTYAQYASQCTHCEPFRLAHIQAEPVLEQRKGAPDGCIALTGGLSSVMTATPSWPTSMVALGAMAYCVVPASQAQNAVLSAVLYRQLCTIARGYNQPRQHVVSID